MIEYQYIARTKDGEIQKGAVEADTEFSAAKVLSGKDLYPIEIFVKEKSSFSFINKVPTKEKVFLIRQLATTINAGLPIAQALNTLKSQITNKKLLNIIEQVSRDVEGGMPLSSSFSKFPETFSQIDITLIAAGETSGSLDKSMLRLADTIENDYRVTKKIRGAFIYPGFILAVVIGVIVLMSTYVMPQMEGLYSSFGNAKLPLLTRVILGMSHGVTKYGILMLIVLAALVVAIRVYLKTENGRYNWDSLKLRIPIVGKFLKMLYAARFSRTLAGLVGSGVSILDSLGIVSKAIGNDVYKLEIQEAAKKVKGGIPLSTPLKNSENFQTIVSQMIRVGEQTGEMDGMLEKLADYFENEVDDFVRNITSILEPVIIVIMAIFVGFVLVGVMLPIYNIGKVIK